MYLNIFLSTTKYVEVLYDLYSVTPNRIQSVIAENKFNVLYKYSAVPNLRYFYKLIETFR